MQDKENVKGSDALKEIAAILAAGIIRMKEKGLIRKPVPDVKKNINKGKCIC